MAEPSAAKGMGDAEVLDCALPSSNDAPGRILEFKGTVPAAKLAMELTPVPMKLQVEPADAAVKLVAAEGAMLLDFSQAPNVKRVTLDRKSVV